jgi:hypothetical protein
VIQHPHTCPNIHICPVWLSHASASGRVLFGPMAPTRGMPLALSKTSQDERKGTPNKKYGRGMVGCETCYVPLEGRILRTNASPNSAFFCFATRAGFAILLLLSKGSFPTHTKVNIFPALDAVWGMLFFMVRRWNVCRVLCFVCLQVCVRVTL